MTRRFCGIDLGPVIDGFRPIDELRSVAAYALEEAQRDALPYHPVRDDGQPAERYCLLIFGRHGRDFYFVMMDGPKTWSQDLPDLPVQAIHEAILALPDGEDVTGDGALGRVIDSGFCAAGVVCIAQTKTGAVNVGFCRNPKLERDQAARLLKAYMMGQIGQWTGRN
jgi:hypothetical protein